MKVGRWTGRSACQLQEAMRESNEGFAALLGVATRTVAGWHELPDRVPLPEIQRALDEALARLTPDEAARMQALTGDAPAAGGDPQVAASRDGWLATRRALGRHRAELTRAVAKMYPDSDRIGCTGVLSPAAWRLPEPVDLADVDLVWAGDAPAPAVTGQHAETVPLRPLAAGGQRYTRYHRAMRDLDRPRLFENRLSYRLLEVDVRAGRPRLALGSTCYFDAAIDVGEALAHEVALAAVDSRGAHPERVTWDALPFRRLVRDPFDLARYPLLTSVSTLTVRRSPAGTTFVLLRRDPAKVAIAGGMLSVVPTGVFQPASVLPAPGSPDFDLWRNVQREYSEEFLGNPEHDGDGPPVDYTAEPFRSLDAARAVGQLQVLCLGVGVDALNLVGDVLTVSVFDGDVYDALFDGMVQANDEGDVITGDAEQFRFDEATVSRLLSGGHLAPSGAACLDLAWRARAAIL